MPDLSIAIIIILLMLAVVFIAPFHISLNMEKDGPLIQGFYKIGWLGITLRREKISPPIPEDMRWAQGDELEGEPGEDKAREKSEREAEEILKEEHKQPPMQSLDPKELIEALPALARVFMNLIRSIDIVKISSRISFGLDDPAETAAMSGYLWSMASAVGLYRANIYIEPYFEGERLDGRFLAEIKARLLWIVLALVKALMEEKIRRLIIEMIRKEMIMRETAGREPA